MGRISAVHLAIANNSQTCEHFDIMRNLSASARSSVVALILGLCLIADLRGTSCFAAESINQLTEEDKAGGWKLLFDGKTLQGWHSFKTNTVAGGWVVEDGWLHCLAKDSKQGGGDIISNGEFDNFDLQWE